MSQLDLLGDLIAAAKRAGADAADAVMVAGTSLSVTLRAGQTEHLERAEGRDLGLRVFVGKRSAMVSSSSLDPTSFARLAEQAVAMAKVVPEDPYGGLADEARMPDDIDLDVCDMAEPDAASLIGRAKLAEDAALAVAGVTQAEGAEAGYSRTESAIVTSAGFAGRTARSGHSVSVSALAGTGTGMERDYDYTSAVFLADLEDAGLIGRNAGERAVRRLNPSRPKTAVLPVVYDPRVSAGLIGHFIGAINGAGIARGTSFLKDSLGKQVFAPGIIIRDDPRRVRGLRSRIFDGEGVPTAPRDLIADGILTGWLLDSRTARQLGLKTTGNAARGTSAPPSPSATNLTLQPGTMSPAELMDDIKEGLYVTELMGTAVNGITGDYSRGASGFMIRNGVLAEPVGEITIAGTLQHIFAHMVPANDLRLRRGTDAPTVRVDGLTMAGG